MDSFSNFLSSLDRVEKVENEGKISKARSKRCGMCDQCMRGDCGVCNHCKDMTKFGGSGKSKQACKERKCNNMVNSRSHVKSDRNSGKLSNPRDVYQSQHEDHNYQRKPNFTEMFSLQNNLMCEKAGKLLPGLEITRSAGNIQENEMHTKGAMNMNMSEGKSSELNRKERMHTEEVAGGNNNDNGGKRKLFDDEFLPDIKKLLSEDLGHLNIKKQLNIELSCITKAEAEVTDEERKPSFNIIREIVESIVAKREVSSVRSIKGKSIDFRCTICKKLPRKLNRSELYRHYAQEHFGNKLREEFGHLKICPFCHLDLNNVSSASHFGQKHCFVEKFLPAEAWIPGSWLKSCQKKILNNPIKVCEKQVDLSTEEDTWVWPEIPDGFDPEGHVRECEGAFTSATQSHEVASFYGEGIEVVTDECSVHRELVKSSVGWMALHSALEQVIKCRICKIIFDKKQLAVTHVHSKHFMKGSGDVLHDFDVLIRTGYIFFKCSDPSVSLCQNMSVEEPDLTQEEAEPQSMELTREEWEMIFELNDEDWEEAFAVKNMEGGRESGYSTGSGYQGGSSS